MPDAEEQIVRRLLTAIDDDAGVSQRGLSDDIGIAVGSVNWYLKRCVNKGLIKLQQAPVKRYLYYLTPQGFDEKARLTAAFIQSSFELYRLGRRECADFFRDCAQAGKQNVVLAGDGDFAEIAVLSSLDTEAKAHMVIDGDSNRETCAGVPVVPSLDAALDRLDAPPGAIFVSALNDTKGAYHAIKAQAVAADLSPEHIHVPRILNYRPGRDD